MQSELTHSLTPGTVVRTIRDGDAKGWIIPAGTVGVVRERTGKSTYLWEVAVDFVGFLEDGATLENVGFDVHELEIVEVATPDCEPVESFDFTKSERSAIMRLLEVKLETLEYNTPEYNTLTDVYCKLDRMSA